MKKLSLLFLLIGALLAKSDAHAAINIDNKTKHVFTDIYIQVTANAKVNPPYFVASIPAGYQSTPTSQLGINSSAQWNFKGMPITVTTATGQILCSTKAYSYGAATPTIHFTSQNSCSIDDQVP
ncbi:MAG: hypothetical protein HYX35_02610 [Proteobacteria bacterium]|nr:hypothetical protein [Pseudomonadota bacterium]